MPERSDSAATTTDRGPELTDDLTGLPDRSLLREHLTLALARARDDESEVALLHVGLDDFRLVNDSLGYDAGDGVLCEVASRLRGALRQTNVVARPGEDRFCVMLADLDRSAADVIEIVVGQIMAAVEEPLSVNGSSFQLGASIGVSVFPVDAEDEETLMRHAEAAMHEAKGAGRGHFVVYAGGTQEALERLTMTARLREALRRDDLVLHYQPIVELPDGRPAGVEALLRWRDGNRGLIPPLKFIPVAEYTGLIQAIGDWVLDRACGQAREWQLAGLRVPVSVNVSLRQFAATGFAAGVARRLAEHALDPSMLMLEITESTAMRDPACVEPVFAELHQAGVRIAIDDFGAGYSSLSRLQRMPVDFLKIDRALLAGAPEDAEAARLAVAAVDLVRSLGRTAIAEGVETEEQRRFLAELGCPLAQGFHFARPLPAEEVTALLRPESAEPAAGT